MTSTTSAQQSDPRRVEAARLGGLRRYALHGPLGTLESRRRGGIATQRRLKADPEFAKRTGLVVRKSIRVPVPSEELAEFIGIFLGDGGFRNAQQLAISFNLQQRFDEYSQVIGKQKGGEVRERLNRAHC